MIAVYRLTDYTSRLPERGVPVCLKSWLNAWSKSWLKSAWNKHGCFSVPCSTMLRNRQSPSRSGTTYADFSHDFKHRGTHHYWSEGHGSHLAFSRHELDEFSKSSSSSSSSSSFIPVYWTTDSNGSRMQPAYSTCALGLQFLRHPSLNYSTDPWQLPFCHDNGKQQESRPCRKLQSQFSRADSGQSRSHQSCPGFLKGTSSSPTSIRHSITRSLFLRPDRLPANWLDHSGAYSPSPHSLFGTVYQPVRA